MCIPCAFRVQFLRISHNQTVYDVYEKPMTHTAVSVGRVRKNRQTVDLQRLDGW